MIDNPNVLRKTINSRKELYPPDLEKQWREAKPENKQDNGVTILTVLGHEVVYAFEEPYMKRLGEIASRNGGNVLNVGYGLGILDKEIERYRQECGIKKHCIIELNKYLAESARNEEFPWEVREGSWQDILEEFDSEQFDGIAYDGYPLSLDEVHRDGIPFIQRVIEKKLLRSGGVLTFFADVKEEGFGKEFISYVTSFGFTLKTEKVTIQPLGEHTQYCREGYLIAPILRLSK